MTDLETARAPLAERALAQRVRAVPPSGIRRFFDILATMDDVISLGVGEPDFDTPREIVEAGVESLREGRTHYTSNFGTIELRRALSAHLERLYGVRYDPATEILVTVGASEAVDLALRATCDPGDEVILHEPSYVAYVPAIVFAGGVVRHVATSAANDFALDPAAVEAAITPRTKALFLGYPANPTGAVLDDDVQDELARIAERHDLLVYSDEIYDRLAYGTYRHRAFSSLPGMRERTILMGGFSKAYAMTGWRVGWMCAPAGILEGIVKVHQYGIMSAPTVAQDAALAALQAGEPAVQAMVAEYDRRRRLLVDGLNAHRPADVRAPRRLLRLPGHHVDRPDLRRVHRAPAARGEGRGGARRRVRALGRRPRAHVLRDRVRAAGRGDRPDRPVRGRGCGRPERPEPARRGPARRQGGVHPAVIPLRGCNRKDPPRNACCMRADLVQRIDHWRTRRCTGATG